MDQQRKSWCFRLKLGLRVLCFCRISFGFYPPPPCHGKSKTDDQVTVPIAEGAKKNVFPALNQVSYDKGFWSPTNLEQLDDIFGTACSTQKKGSSLPRIKNVNPLRSFIRAKRKHSAVESDINALESNGLDKCPDKGLDAFKRYVALAVVAGNLKRLGNAVA